LWQNSRTWLSFKIPIKTSYIETVVRHRRGLPALQSRAPQK